MDFWTAVGGLGIIWLAYMVLKPSDNDDKPKKDKRNDKPKHYEQGRRYDYDIKDRFDE